MKFTHKMIALVALILAISLSLSGLLLIDSTFRGQLASQIGDAQEDMKLYALTVQALSANRLNRSEDSDFAAEVSELFSDNVALNGYEFRLSDASWNVLLCSDAMPNARLLPENADEMQTRIVGEGEGVFLLTAQTVTLGGEAVCLERCREITDVFAAMKTSVRRYEIITLVILAVGIGVTALLTVLLTRPLRSISRTAKQLSMGQYTKRVRVRSHDELGRLADNFNDMADSLESKIRELEDAAQRQKDFTASFAHELKTPLTSVIGYADTLRSRELSREQQLEAADYIFSEGKRLETMSFALLDLFALEREEPIFRSVSAHLVAQEVARSSRYCLEQKHIRLTLRVGDAPLHCAPELIKTLLYNLIDNARKASEPNGEILLLGERSDGGYRFTVRDYGCGIPPESLRRITEPFYMVDKSRARANGGAGLGLALCSRIAQVHHTALEFDSTEGQGTAVSFLLGGERQ